MKKRTLSILLVLALCLGLTVAALASGETAEDAFEEPTPAEEIAEVAVPAEATLSAEEPAPAEEEAEESEPALDGVEISGSCGENLAYTLDDKGALTISGTGEMYSDFTWPRTDVIRKVVIEEGMTGIRDFAFSGCANLAEVEIADSVKSIGRAAFNGCPLVSVTIPDSATSIASYAFSGCDCLETLTIGNGVKTIGEGAFQGCTNLETLTLGSSVESIGDYAFTECESLASLTIPNSVKSIGKGAFAGGGFTSLMIPDSVTSIGDSAFAGCDKLTDIYYNGSTADWSAIEIGGSNDLMTGATIHYDSFSPVQGDMDGDGFLTPNDAAIILRICAEG